MFQDQRDVEDMCKAFTLTLDMINRMPGATTLVPLQQVPLEMVCAPRPCR